MKKDRNTRDREKIEELLSTAPSSQGKLLYLFFNTGRKIIPFESMARLAKLMDEKGDVELNIFQLMAMLPHDQMTKNSFTKLRELYSEASKRHNLMDAVLALDPERRHASLFLDIGKLTNHLDDREILIKCSLLLQHCNPGVRKQAMGVLLESPTPEVAYANLLKFTHLTESKEE